MAKTIIAEGRTSTEAIEKGLNELGVSKDRVDIKILDNDDKRSFFSILAPRVVKVEMTLKENIESNKTENKSYKEKQETYIEKEKVHLNAEELEIAKKNLKEFLDDFISKLSDMKYNISSDEEYIYIDMDGEDSKTFIGYRGETLNALQTILSSIANKNLERKAHIILNVAGYREKRKKALEELADKLSKTVIRTGKQLTLEPMSAYERKVIHNRLQNSDKVKTYSIGEEPYRKVVITRK